MGGGMGVQGEGEGEVGANRNTRLINASSFPATWRRQAATRERERGGGEMISGHRSHLHCINEEDSAAYRIGSPAVIVSRLLSVSYIESRGASLRPYRPYLQSACEAEHVEYMHAPSEEWTDNALTLSGAELGTCSFSILHLIKMWFFASFLNWICLMVGCFNRTGIEVDYYYIKHPHN